MPTTRSLGSPNIRGDTIEDIRASVQFELQRLYAHLDRLAGVSATAQFYGPVDVGGNRLMGVAAPQADTDAVPAGHAITRQRDPNHARGTEQWDARGLQIFALGDADNPQDAVPLHQVGSMIDLNLASILDLPLVTTALTDILNAERVLTAESGVTTVTDNGPNATIVVGIATNGIGYTKQNQGAATSIVGVAGGSTANKADIAASADGQVLRRAAGALAFGAIDLADADAVGTSVLGTANGGTGSATAPSGTYTPALTNVANVAASTAYECQYLRLGNTVLVSGRFDADPTGTGATQLGIALPIASNFGAAEDCGGVAFASGIAGQGAAIVADAANNRAEAQWIAVDITNQPMYFVFAYQVI